MQKSTDKTSLSTTTVFPCISALSIVLFLILKYCCSITALDTTLISIIVILFGSIYMFHEFYWKRRHLPPGPIPWLLAGNMPQILLNGADFDSTFLRWSEHYGGIFTFWIGPIPMVMVSDVDLLRKYFIRFGEVFSGRWQNFITHTFMDGHNGVVQIQGEKWREQRRFSLHVLRDFGLGRNLMEEKIQFEVDALVDYLQRRIVLNASTNDTEEDLVIDVTKPIAICIANIINNILFGRRYEHDDSVIIKIHHMLDTQSALVVQPIMGIYLTLPWTIHVPVLNSSWLKLLEVRNQFWAFLEGHLEEHRQLFDPFSQPSDFTFAYLQEMHKRRENGEAMGHFSQRQLKMLLLDLFFAGSETTVTTTKWGILMLILHPEVQERCHLELEKKIGQRKVTLKDKIDLPYLQATICEIQRVANILPINLLRTCLEDFEVDGFHFPVGTMVIPQVSIAMNSPANFEEPKKFCPDRFIDHNGNLHKSEAFLPFSIGKRQCLGESLAKAELFLIFANLIQHFEFGKEHPHSELSRKRVYGLTISPQPYLCRIRQRKLSQKIIDSTTSK